MFTYKVLDTTRVNQYWSMTVMLYMRLLSPTGQGVAYHCTFHRPLPSIAWSIAPCSHSGQRLVTNAVSQSPPPVSALTLSQVSIALHCTAKSACMLELSYWCMRCYGRESLVRVVTNYKPHFMFACMLAGMSLQELGFFVHLCLQCVMLRHAALFAAAAVKRADRYSRHTQAYLGATWKGVVAGMYLEWAWCQFLSLFPGM